MTRTIRIVAALAALFIAAECSAQTAPAGYPARQVRVIVPYPPGGPTDVIARLISQKMTEALGQTFFVENLRARAARSAPAPPPTLPATAIRSWSSPTILRSPPSPTASCPTIRSRTSRRSASCRPRRRSLSLIRRWPAKSLKELVGACAKEPGKLSYGSMSIGFGQLTAERFFRYGLKADMVRVPFQGAAPLINSTVGGHTPARLHRPAAGAPLIKEGKLRALAVVGSQRSPDLPDVPTLAEAGVPNQDADLLIGFVAPAGTPSAICRPAPAQDRGHRADARRQAASRRARVHARSPARPRPMPRKSSVTSTPGARW